MSSTPFLSIVIPVYNRANVVEATLRSIESQKAGPLKVVLVDNASSDGSAQVLKRWKDSVAGTDLDVTIINESRPGAGAARNAGLAVVDTPWTMFFDSDDTMFPGHIERLANAVAAHPEVDVFGWDMLFRRGAAEQTFIFRDHDMEFFNVFKSCMGTLRYAARTELFRQAGGWTEGLGVADDVELGSRIIALKPKAMRIDNRLLVAGNATDGSIMTESPAVEQYLQAMEKVKSVLEPSKRHWVDLQEILMLRTWGASHPISAGKVDDILRRTRGLRKRLWQLFDYYTQQGGRGVARMYYPLRNLI